jgi:nucleotide-binding universal stress UspA family protein
MKVIATFDGSEFAEATLPLLARIANLPDCNVLMLGVVSDAGGRRQRPGQHRPSAAVMSNSDPFVVMPPQARYAETRGQAIESRIAQMEDYLRGLVAQLPQTASYTVEAHIDQHAAETIVARAREVQPDLIVMATHGRTGLVRALFGSVAEDVVRAGVAPVLLAHPEDVRRDRAETAEA